MGCGLINMSLDGWSRSYDGPKFHAVLCDPPYGLSFMGKKWDEMVEAKAWGEAIMPHLYPGALVLMFGGTRTWHRLACGMEDAGFEIWDTLMWLYGQGFPKAQDISKLIDKANGKAGTFGDPKSDAHAGWIKRGRMRGDNNEEGWQRPWMDDSEQVSNAARQYIAADSQSQAWSGHKTTALKPAWEPILCFKKPLEGTYAEMAMQYGSGALNVDGGRIEHNEECRMMAPSQANIENPSEKYRQAGRREAVLELKPEGRWPANLILDAEAGAMLDAQTGTLTSGKMKAGTPYPGGNVYGAPSGCTKADTLSDSGGASRFFYCAKASTAERNRGLEGRNTHPTVKPIALAKYLATLILPPDSVKPRRLLVPFAGSGSEMIGAEQAGWDEIVGIEREADYCATANARIFAQQPEQLSLDTQ